MSKIRETHKKTTKKFLIVGIGASAGGLEALKLFLAALNNDTGMAFVVIQHLDPNHASLSGEILSQLTRMKIQEISEGTSVEPNHIYMLPPNASVRIHKRVLHLLPPEISRGRKQEINQFFKSLALDQKDLTAGIIFSGTGSDGTEGIRAIKEEGGITFAQLGKSAHYPAMPESAISSGNVDFVLTPSEIAEKINEISEYFYKLKTTKRSVDSDLERTFSQEQLSPIFEHLKKYCYIDFKDYKINTIMRRLERRMHINRIDSLDTYTQFMMSTPFEIRSLCADLLIHVTYFFRDSAAYKALKEEVFPNLIDNLPAGQTLRLWVPGCSTGEEPYSLAISLIEYLEKNNHSIPFQIFATDVSEEVIQRARLGVFSNEIEGDLTSEQLKRFFTRTEDGKYKISKVIRDRCLFSRHDLITDPPFAKIDFISCRNLLIYFNPTLQKKVIPIFHYSLKPEGFLCLCRSESTGTYTNLFKTIDKINKFYAKRKTRNILNIQFPISSFVPGKIDIHPPPLVEIRPEAEAGKLADLAIQNEFPGVLVDHDMEILQFRGKTALYLEPASGAASYNLLKMIRVELLPTLRTLIHEAGKKRVSVEQRDLEFKNGRKSVHLNLKVIPVSQTGTLHSFYLVLFESVKALPAKKTKSIKLKKVKEVTSHQSRQVISQLQEEILSAQKYHQTVIEKFAATQEELSIANEELQSTNEEFQSTNEELETAKEELQSSNEELISANEELQSRSADQTVLTNDLINLLASIEIPIVMLGPDFRIRRFTPLAGAKLNFIPSDVGRPIGDFKFNFTFPDPQYDLEKMNEEVLQNLNPRETEVQDRKGKWYRMQIKPYRTVDNRIDGTVIALVDIDDLKRAIMEKTIAQDAAVKANRSKDVFLATLSHELRTPLTSILGYAQMLNTQKLSEDKAMKAIKSIEESAHAQFTLIEELLDVSKIIAGKVPLKMALITPLEVIESAIEAIRPMAEAKSIHIKCNLEKDVGMIYADQLRLKQVFWNLLNNAIKFSDSGATIEIKLTKEINRNNSQSFASISFKDSGKGIGPEYLNKIFDKFFQENNSNLDKYTGLGLGLSIVKNLVEVHKGTILAESQGENKGATFTVKLPISHSG